MNISSYDSSYHYTRQLSNFIESCFQDKMVSLKDLACFLNVSPSYVYFLYRKLKNDMYFVIRATPHYERIKLHPLSCFLSIRSALRRDIILKTLSRHDYVTYIAPYHGDNRGIYCTFLVPSGNEGDLTTFFELLLSHDVIDDYVVHSLMLTGNIVMGFDWYDFSKDVWCFNWPSLLDDILSRIDSYDYELKSFDDFEASKSDIKFDFYDLFILHHIEHDIFTNIGALAPKVRVTRQNLSYHYRNHVYRLVKSIRPYWVPSFKEHSTFFILDLTFENNKGLRGFIGSLQRKPIACSYALYRSSQHPSIMLLGFLPYKEFFNFMKLLDSLKDYGVVSDHALYILNMETSAGRALPYHCFDGFKWHFDIEPCAKEVLRLLKQAYKDTARLAKAVDKSIGSR